MTSHQPHTAGTIYYISYLTDEKLRHREVKTLGQGHTAGKWWYQESDLNHYAMLSRAIRDLV